MNSMIFEMHSQIISSLCFKVSNSFAFHNRVLLCFTILLFKVWSITCELVQFRTSGSNKDLPNQNVHFNKMPRIHLYIKENCMTRSYKSCFSLIITLISFHQPQMLTQHHLRILPLSVGRTT